MNLGTIDSCYGPITIELETNSHEPDCCFVKENGNIIDTVSWEEAEVLYPELF